MKEIFENVIKHSTWDLTGLLGKVDKYHIEGKLTDGEREELYAMARQTPQAQYDVRREIELLWQAVRALQGGGQAAWTEFVQPTGAHDAYHTGSLVSFNGQKYRCLQDNCVWSPAVLPGAWEEVHD